MVKTTYPDKPIKDFNTWRIYIHYLNNLYKYTRHDNLHFSTYISLPSL